MDAHRTYNDTYLPIRIENFPSDLWQNFKKFFKTGEDIPDADDEDP